MAAAVMRQLACALVMVWAFGCERHERTLSTCLVDDLGPLRADWRERTDCTTTDDICAAQCLVGDGDACLNRALAFQAKSDTSHATAMFERGCRLGLALACTNWAASTWGRKSQQATLGCTTRVFDRACSAGDVWACTMVARNQIEFSRTPFDIALGSARLIRECAAVAGPPCRMLAVYLENGWIGDRTDALSRRLLRKACDGGDELACGDHARATDLLVHIED